MRKIIYYLLIIIFIIGCQSNKPSTVIETDHSIDWLPERKDVQAGAILVPENHDEPNAKKIKIYGLLKGLKEIYENSNQKGKYNNLLKMVDQSKLSPFELSAYINCTYAAEYPKKDDMQSYVIYRVIPAIGLPFALITSMVIFYDKRNRNTYP